ncbi:DUF2442 domain-containing protein [Leptodesmis sichuanensis]|uniref:DUF2442 domain-containing protein n=1 Tax=Leptodesmis sichuanensis TaxID=2906798 RepID=UPI001F15B324|nr:DUF2442 domain-containing protein [Leptodesmis sichuanensis]UIE36439.1 DUF2442 domain-containing protein [Leptodesmis sichuanensis A121]
MNKQHNIESIDFDGAWMILAVDGQVYRLSLAQVSDRLAQASEVDRKIYRIAPSGYGVHWPTLDEDLSINGLLRVAAVRSHAS